MSLLVPPEDEEEEEDVDPTVPNCNLPVESGVHYLCVLSYDPNKQIMAPPPEYVNMKQKQQQLFVMLFVYIANNVVPREC